MLLCALACGAALGVLYDLIAPLRSRRTEVSWRLARLQKRLSPPSVLRLNGARCVNNQGREWVEVVRLFFGDVLFCLAFSVTVVLLLYYTNDGQWRLSVPVIMFLSFVFYRATLGRPIRQLLTCVYTIIGLLLVWIVSLLTFPVRFMWHLSEKPRRALAAHGRRMRERVSLYAKTRKEMRRTEQKTDDIPQVPKRRPPDGKTVFTRGGYKPNN